MAGQPTYGERWDAAALALRPHGIRLHDWAAYEAWVPAIILEYNKRRGRAVVLVDSTTGDPTLSRIEAMQRERLTLHAGPLALTWAKAQNPGAITVTGADCAHARRVGPHVVLAWLHPEVLRKQSVGVPDAWAAPRLGLLACDRRIDPFLPLWAHPDDAPPSVVAASIRKTPFAPLLMTTLYTLQASDGSIGLPRLGTRFRQRRHANSRASNPPSAARRCFRTGSSERADPGISTTSLCSSTMTPP